MDASGGPVTGFNNASGTWRRGNEVDLVGGKEETLSLFVKQDGNDRAFDARDVNQGGLGDCWFLAGMAIVADVRPDLFEKIFMPHDQKNATLGVYSVRFFKNGEWQVVTVDDHVPASCKPGYYERIMYVNMVKGGEVWPMILEKAYAKLHGSYEAIEAGHTSDALTDLTGNPSFAVDLDGMQAEIADGSLWKSIVEWHGNGFMMGCGSHSGSDTNHNELGIVLGHAFSILGVKEVDSIKFMNIRNPHGNGGQEWTGDYSDSSDKWTKRLRSKLGAPENAVDEGAWWMTFEDWAENYSTLYVCRTFPDDWDCVTVAGRWKGESAGGCRNYDSSYKNPHFLLKVSRPCTVHLTQLVEDDRGRSDVEAQCHGHNVYDRPVDGQTGGYPIKSVYRGQSFGSSGSFSWRREIMQEYKFERTDRPYVIIPSTFEPGKEGKFWLTARCEKGGIESFQPWTGNV